MLPWLPVAAVNVVCYRGCYLLPWLPFVAMVPVVTLVVVCCYDFCVLLTTAVFVCCHDCQFLGGRLIVAKPADA